MSKMANECPQMSKNDLRCLNLTPNVLECPLQKYWNVLKCTTILFYVQKCPQMSNDNIKCPFQITQNAHVYKWPEMSSNILKFSSLIFLQWINRKKYLGKKFAYSTNSCLNTASRSPPTRQWWSWSVTEVLLEQVLALEWHDSQQNSSKAALVTLLSGLDDPLGSN